MRIELRSDTFTQPTPAMLEAMMKARVGDDVFEEDPTVNELGSGHPRCLGWKRACFALVAP